MDSQVLEPKKQELEDFIKATMLLLAGFCHLGHWFKTLDYFVLSMLNC
jgi:hypothetical protein